MITVERRPRPQTQSSLSICTEGGVQIDEGDAQLANTKLSVAESLEPGSNVTVERASH
jgi:hypothetical protein